MKPHKKAEKFWDRAAKNYDKEEKKDEQTYIRIIEKAKTHLKNTDIVLDYGCGTGLISNEIADNVKVKILKKDGSLLTVEALK